LLFENGREIVKLKTEIEEGLERLAMALESLLKEGMI